jgi:hypothetical protein
VGKKEEKKNERKRVGAPLADLLAIPSNGAPRTQYITSCSLMVDVPLLRKDGGEPRALQPICGPFARRRPKVR